MRIIAYLMSGREVACACPKPAVRAKKKTYVWRDTRDCGGVFDRLEDWMRHVVLEQRPQLVSFRFDLQ